MMFAPFSQEGEGPGGKLAKTLRARRHEHKPRRREKSKENGPAARRVMCSAACGRCGPGGGHGLGQQKPGSRRNRVFGSGGIHVGERRGIFCPVREVTSGCALPRCAIRVRAPKGVTLGPEKGPKKDRET